MEESGELGKRQEMEVNLIIQLGTCSGDTARRAPTKFRTTVRGLQAKKILFSVCCAYFFSFFFYKFFAGHVN